MNTAYTVQKSGTASRFTYLQKYEATPTGESCNRKPIVPAAGDAFAKILGIMMSSCTNSATRSNGFFTATKDFAAFLPAIVNLILFLELLFTLLLLSIPLFTRTFYHACQDVAKLADILGHSSIETTHIYLISTGAEHRSIPGSWRGWANFIEK